MPSTTPGTSVVEASNGVALRTASDQATTQWPVFSCRFSGARHAAWMVVLDASEGERTIPVCVRSRPSALRHRHETTLGTRSSEVMTNPESASALRTALRVEMSTRSALRSLLKPGGACPVSVCTDASLASVLDWVIMSFSMDAYSEESAAAQ